MSVCSQMRRAHLISEVMKGGREGLVPKRVTVTKKGKTFQQTVYVKPGEKPAESRTMKEPAPSKVAPKLSMSSVLSAIKSSKDYATSAASAFAAGETKDGVNYLKGMSKQLGDITYAADKAGLKIDPKVGEKIARLDDEILSITQMAKTGTAKGLAEAARGRAKDIDEIVKLLSAQETAANKAKRETAQKSGASMIMRRNHLISNSRF